MDFYFSYCIFQVQNLHLGLFFIVFASLLRFPKVYALNYVSKLFKYICNSYKKVLANSNSRALARLVSVDCLFFFFFFNYGSHFLVIFIVHQILQMVHYRDSGLHYSLKKILIFVFCRQFSQQLIILNLYEHDLTVFQGRYGKSSKNIVFEISPLWFVSVFWF